MSIGDKPVNAVFNNDGATSLISFNKGDLNQNGLTYREWLIGQLACNVGAIVRLKGFENDIAEGLIRQADAIIKQLDKDDK